MCLLISNKSLNNCTRNFMPALLIHLYCEIIEINVDVFDLPVDLNTKIFNIEALVPNLESFKLPSLFGWNITQIFNIEFLLPNKEPCEPPSLVVDFPISCIFLNSNVKICCRKALF